MSLQESNMIVLPPYQYSVLVGLILSDGCLNFASKTNKNARLTFNQSLSKAEYVSFVFNLLSHYCNAYPQLTKSIRGGKSLYGLSVYTRGLPCFTKLYNLFYVNKVKVVPHNIYDLLTPVAFAHLLMGDGYFSNKGIGICTDSFVLVDVVRLMNVLITRYELKCTLHKSNLDYRIYISRHSVSKVVEIVKPHLILSMYYKVGL